MANTLKFGGGTWATKEGSTLAYNDENENYKPLPFNFERDSIATRVNKEGLIEVVGNDIPRIDYTDSADGVLLLENSATNLATYSEDFSDSSWNKVNSSGSSSPIITSDYGISPDGTQNADRIQVSRASGVGDYSSIYKSITTSSSNRGLSVWLKSLNGTPTILIANNNGTYVSQQITTEWVRYELDLGVGTLTELQLSVVGSNFIQGVSESADFLAWGYQLEIGIPTSYIPTSGSTVPRAAETANGSGNSEVFNDSQGSLFLNINTPDTSAVPVISLSNGSFSNEIEFAYYGTNQFNFILRVSGGTPNVIGNIVGGSFSKFCVTYTTTDFKVYLNGFLIGSNTLPSPLNGLDVFDFSLPSGTNPFYGKTKEIGYYDTALTDEELEYITSYRSLNELVTELNLNTL